MLISAQKRNIMQILCIFALYIKLLPAFVCVIDIIKKKNLNIPFKRIENLPQTINSENYLHILYEIFRKQTNTQ
jgi:hypothetical protein